jgi:exodeoxyribonuclease V alpha subunit
MQIRNDYEKSVFNGDIGIIRDIRPPAGGAEGSSLTVEMLDGRSVPYQRDELDQIVHAFAVSVHKSQGSEYPAVVIPLVTQHYLMLQRNLLYTAITRGKRLVVLLGMKRAVHMAVRNDATRVRWTWLAERIREATS